MAVYLMNEKDYVVADDQGIAQRWYEQETELRNVPCSKVTEDFLVKDWATSVTMWASEYINLKSVAGPFLIATTSC